jgi:NhaA family Na+:H+ antiporter
VRPLDAFFRLEAASGLVLLACAIAAFGWANLGGAAMYRALLGTTLTLGIADATVRFTLLALVNDGLMTVFFFLVGMEIKRELVVGELRSVARAALPAIAAVGGMVVPAGIYFLLNRGGPGQAGWGIPMATDIAFCIAVLMLLKSRVPRALVVFVTALAIFDDIGGILAIAVFYGHGLDARWIAAAAVLTAAIGMMGRGYVRSGPAYALAGALLWYALHHGGIHATIAGVIVGLAVPARPRRDPRALLSEVSAHAGDLLRRPDDVVEDAVLAIEEKMEDEEPPLTRFVHHLHPWVAFGVMPAFAFANSGVDLSALGVNQLTGRIAAGAALGLFVGKQLGIFAFTMLAVRLGVSPAPGNASPAKLLGASMIAGIGFTVALFIAGLAFPGSPELLDEAKIGIIVGSLVSGIAGALLLRATALVAEAPRGAVAPAVPAP